MPAYDYDCTVCLSTIEITRPMGRAKEIERVACFTCGTFTLHKRRWAATSVQFKGPGFYTTDSRDEIDQWTFKNLDKD